MTPALRPQRRPRQFRLVGDMVRKDPAQLLVDFESAVFQWVGDCIDHARSVGRGGDLDQSQRIIEHGLKQYLPDRTLELDSMRRQYNLDNRLARANINNKGRMVGHLMGRGSFAAAVRGGMARGRDMSRVRLAKEETTVRNAFDRVRRTLTDLRSQLLNELRLIKEQRVKNL